MARLVGGIGTPHTPMLGIEPTLWSKHGDLEVDRLTKSDLLPTTRSPQEIARELAPELMAERYERMQLGISRLAGALREMEPDLLVIVGDDQRELFLDDSMPAISVFWGSSMWDRPPGREAYPPTMGEAYKWYHGESEECYETSAELGLHIVEKLMASSFDVAQFSAQSPSRSLGHAFLWVYRRLLLGDRTIPFTPLILNTYYPPNQPTPARCVELGQALAAALRSWPEDSRIALVASGGLSHPIISEELDQRVLKSLARQDLADLAALPLEMLREGSSEIRNWITTGAALSDQEVEIVDYVPAYRSFLGSGCGTAFTIWRS